MTDVKPIKIDVFSDIACPYCFVGEKHLLMAKEQFLKENPNYPIEIIFRSSAIIAIHSSSSASNFFKCVSLHSSNPLSKSKKRMFFNLFCSSVKAPTLVSKHGKTDLTLSNPNVPSNINPFGQQNAA